MIVPGDKRSVFVRGKLGGKFAKPVTQGWNALAPIKREPQYIAIFVKGTHSVRVIAEVDSKKSELEENIIVMSNPKRVCIPIRFGKDKLRKFRYTTFRKLLTHNKTDDL